MSRVQQLYQLQHLDSEVDKVKQELAGIAAKLGESVALKTAKAAVEVVEKRVRKTQATVKDLDLEVKSLTDRIDRQEKVLYGGGVRSPKEAANLQEEVASLKRWLESREETLLEAMVEAEETQAELEQAQAELVTIRADWEIAQAQLGQSQHELKTRLAELMEQRPTLTGVIDGEDLKDYEALRQKKAGRAVALVKDSVCQGCGMAASNSKVQQARLGAELIYCSTCGRILYVS